MCLRSMLSAATVGIALFAMAAPAAQAAPPPNPGPPRHSVTIDDPSLIEATNCEFHASKPNLSGTRVTGTGGISSCSGGTPATGTARWTWSSTTTSPACG